MNQRLYSFLTGVALLMGIALIATSLLGCAGGALSRPVKVEQVMVPVAVPCDPPDVPVPVWPLDLLSPTAAIWPQTTAMLAEIELRIGYELQLNAALDACRSSAVAK